MSQSLVLERRTQGPVLGGWLLEGVFLPVSEEPREQGTVLNEGPRIGNPSFHRTIATWGFLKLPVGCCGQGLD